MIAALLRLGPICLAISSALAQDMLAGIGVLISTSQFLIMVDDMSASPGRFFWHYQFMFPSRSHLERGKSINQSDSHAASLKMHLSLLLTR